jgi:hypothetical protein
MTDARRELFKKIIWGDYTLTPDEIENILTVEQDSIHKTMIYRKILMSETWYGILKTLSPTELKEALSEDVVKTIWIQSLRNKYRNARRLLFEFAVPITG